MLSITLVSLPRHGRARNFLNTPCTIFQGKSNRIWIVSVSMARVSLLQSTWSGHKLFEHPSYNFPRQAWYCESCLNQKSTCTCHRQRFLFHATVVIVFPPELSCLPLWESEAAASERAVSLYQDCGLSSKGHGTYLPVLAMLLLHYNLRPNFFLLCCPQRPTVRTWKLGSRFFNFF